MRVLVAIDSFKGSLGSREAADAFVRGFSAVMPTADFVRLTLADGGEGTSDAFREVTGGREHRLESCDALMRPILANYSTIREGSCAVVDVASSSGLTHIATAERNAMRATSYGTGLLIADALKRGCRQIVVGAGGSATSDCGVGLLTALGYRFFDRMGCEIDALRGAEILPLIASIDSSACMPELREAEFVVASDVSAPLYGKGGAAFVFSPQKGAEAKEVELLDSAMREFSRVVTQYTHSDLSQVAGAGSAGGIGYALISLLGARIESGVELLLEYADFDSMAKGCDLVVTGEGHIDHQTLLGKAPMGLLRRAKRLSLRVVAIGGGVSLSKELSECGFDIILPIADPESAPLEQRMQPETTKRNIEQTAMQIARYYRDLDS